MPKIERLARTKVRSYPGYFGYHWARTPVLADRVEQTVAAFPAAACALWRNDGSSVANKAGPVQVLISRITGQVLS